MSAYLYDTETTGVEEPIEVIEHAGIRLVAANDLTPDDEFEMRYRPSKPIELGAMAVHHIMDEDLVGSCYPPSCDCRLPEDCTVIVGHNVDFDWGVLRKPRVRRIDLMAMAWKVWPEIGKVGQGALLYHVDRGHARQLLRGAHSALQDVRNALIVLCAIADKVGGFESWEAMWRFSEGPGCPTRSCSASTRAL